MLGRSRCSFLLCSILMVCPYVSATVQSSPCLRLWICSYRSQISSITDFILMCKLGERWKTWVLKGTRVA